MSVAMAVTVNWTASATVMVITIAVVRVVRLIADWCVRYHNAWWANGCDINRRGIVRSRLLDNHPWEGRKGKTDSDAEVNPGLGQSHATHKNRCNQQ